jgi:hypothetical protein
MGWGKNRKRGQREDHGLNSHGALSLTFSLNEMSSHWKVRNKGGMLPDSCLNRNVVTATG